MFRNLLLIFIGYLLIRFVYGVWKFRTVLKRNMRDMQSNQKQNIPDGEIRYKDAKDKQKQSRDEDGNYVDYEEVE